LLQVTIVQLAVKTDMYRHICFRL